MAKMTVAPFSGIHADGFKIKVGDKEETYYYGSNASYNRDFATVEEPYVSDILQKTINENKISINEFEVVDGWNVYKGNVYHKGVENKKSICKYIQELQFVTK